jgi:hypothetical protein
MNCKTCGGEMIQKSRTRLLVVGILMLAAIAPPFYFPILWAPAVILLLAGIYLLIWAAPGRGLWCRTCKKFSIF